jgi:hypothetical protein
MGILDNPFTRRQQQAIQGAERHIIALYAEACCLAMQLMKGTVIDLERMEQVNHALTEAEHRLQGMLSAAQRLGIGPNILTGLSEEERLTLFEAHFDDTNTSLGALKEMLSQADIREIVEGIDQRP